MSQILDTTLEQQWTAVSRRLLESSKDSVLNGWLSKITPASDCSGEVCLCVPTRFMKEWLVSKEYDQLICSLWQDEDPSLKKVSVKTKTAAVFEPEVQAVETEEICVSPVIDRSETGLDPKFTFDNFIVGKSNEFAVAAAKRVAQMVDVSFNPLYVYSSVGLGKTHLMHSIAWEVKNNFPDRKVLYLSAEKFMYQFVKSLRFDETVSFRDMFRSVDILIIDDIQFICGKKATQEEFFHTFNALVEQGKQIVLCSDSSPLMLQGLEERLKTRIAQGLVVDIHSTTYEMRIGILQSKAALMNATVPADVIAFLAEQITTNVRELEGALRRVVASAQLIGTPITLHATKIILKDLLNIYEKEVTVHDIQKQTADYFDINLSDLKSVRKDRKIARPRQIAMYLAKTMTTKSLPEIGAGFDRDHTTVLHAVKTVESLLSTDSELSDHIERLKRRIKG